MTGAILGGSSVHQAAKLQMIIMFMITASTTLASVITTFAAIAVIVDDQDRIRNDRIESNKTAWLNMSLQNSVNFIRNIVLWKSSASDHDSVPGERTRLLA